MAYISADNLLYYHTGLQSKMSNDYYNKTEVDGMLPSINLNGSTTSSPVFYAPTSAGTSGQVLTSTGGVPVWAAPQGGGGELLTISIDGTNYTYDGSTPVTITIVNGNTTAY